MRQVLSSCSASISELKKNPTALLSGSEGLPIAILSHNRPAAYLIPAKTYEWMVELIDDYQLTKLVEERLKDKDQAVKINLDDL